MKRSDKALHRLAERMKETISANLMSHMIYLEK